jgi:hypothetical protein
VEGGFGVELDGRRVNSADGMDVCPPETTSYHLSVDAGDRTEEMEVTIHVQGAPASDGNPRAEPPASDESPPPEPTQASAPAVPSPTSRPPTASPADCNRSSNEYVTDLAITDIYPGNMPEGQFWVRITNHGPVACQNVNFKFLGCAVLATPKPGGAGIASAENVLVTLNIRPGETQDLPTGIGFDMDQASYMVTCHFAAQSGYSDLNNNNQYYQENIP